MIHMCVNERIAASHHRLMSPWSRTIHTRVRMTAEVEGTSMKSLRHW